MLHELGFLEHRENIVFLGPPGKTHLAVSLAVAAAESGRRIYFGTLGVLIESLRDAHAGGRLKQRLKTLTHPARLVVDEIGNLTVSANGVKLFFQLINSRYGRASTELTSNKGLEEWGETLHDEVMAAGLLDRLLHCCHIVNIRDNSYRMRDRRELAKTLHPIAARAVSIEQTQIEEPSWRSSHPTPRPPLPPREPGCHGPISRLSRSVPFSAPIDT